MISKENFEVAGYLTLFGTLQTPNATDFYIDVFIYYAFVSLHKRIDVKTD